MGAKAKGLKRLYRCDDCGERRFVAWVELNRAARPKCMGCGSARLELVSEEAVKDRERLQRVRVEMGTRSMVPQGALRDAYPKVT